MKGSTYTKYFLEKLFSNLRSWLPPEKFREVAKLYDVYRGMLFCYLLNGRFVAWNKVFWVFFFFGEISATFRKAYQNDRATSDVISQDYHSFSDERLSSDTSRIT